MMLPYPEVVRGWIAEAYNPRELKAAVGCHAIQEAIAKDICMTHGITNFDGKINVLYHVEDMVQEME